MEKLYFILGCTASGKGGVGRELARRLGAEIVSVDSMKVYRRMDIGTAKPAAEVRAAIPHHCLDIVEPSESFSVARFLEYADRALEQIRAASDIVDVVGSYLPLKRAGANFVALCPFHKEKTPSFNVNPHRQIFHCFGCHKGGDVFAFVKEYENIDFPEAVRRLADRAKIPLEYEKNAGEPQARRARFAQAQFRFGVDDIIARERNDIDLFAKLELVHGEIADAKRRLATRQIEFPHAAEPLVVERLRLLAARHETLTPRFQGFRVMQPENFDI